MHDGLRVWLHHLRRNDCYLAGIDGYKEIHEVRVGVPLAARWPSGIVASMDEDDPDDVVLSDSLMNVDSALVVSERLMCFLRDQRIPDLEFLPIGIRNHKGRLVDERYFVVNCSTHIDVLDEAGSKVRLRRFTGAVARVEGLVLRKSGECRKLVRARPLFRIERFGRVTIVSTALAASLDAAGFSGMRWGELADFRSRAW